MGYNFNFNFQTNYSFKSRIFQLPTFGTTYTPSVKFNPIFYTPSYSIKTKSSSLFDTMSLITSLREKFSSKLKTYGDIASESEPVLKKGTPLTLDDETTAMPDYGIVCPKSKAPANEPEITAMPDYGIVCPKDTKKSDIADAGFLANYGIVCSPVEEDTFISTTKYRADDLKMFANYGIVCPNDF